MDFFHGVLIDGKFSEFSKDKLCIECSRPPTSNCSSRHKKQRRVGADMELLGVVGAKSALALADLARFSVATINAKPSSETEFVDVIKSQDCAVNLQIKSPANRHTRKYRVRNSRARAKQKQGVCR